MEKYVTDERTGLKYELAGDYYIIAGDNEPDEEQKQSGYGDSGISAIYKITAKYTMPIC